MKTRHPPRLVPTGFRTLNVFCPTGEGGGVETNTTNAAKRRPVPARKLDPTRTGTVRRVFARALRARFRALRGALYKLLVADDAFGLQHRRDVAKRAAMNAFNPDQSRDEQGQWTSDGVAAVGRARDEVNTAKLRLRAAEDRQDANLEQISELRAQLDATTRKVEEATAEADRLKAKSQDGRTDLERLGVALDQSKARSRGAKKELRRLRSGKTAPIAFNAPGAYAFDSSPEQLAKFEAWVRKQLKAELTSKSQEELWRKYLADAFRRGAGRAFDDARKRDLSAAEPGSREDDMLQGGRREFLRSAFGRPETKEKVGLIASRTFADMEGVTAQMATRMGRTLADGLARGANPREVARAMDDDLDLGQARAELVARTEFIRAHAEGQLDAFDALGVAEIGVEVEWSTAGDDRVCPECASMEGRTFTIADAHGLIPAHPNAVFAGSTFVPYGECVEFVRANYRGPAVVLTVDGGRRRTTVGPNHPLLTRRGMVRAAELHEGDEIIYDLRNDDPSGQFVNVHHQKVPLVEDAFETCLAVGNNTGVAASGSDLHGDVVACYGEVQAVWPARNLLSVRDSGGIEKLREGNFVLSDTDPEGVPGVGAGLTDGRRVYLPAPSRVGGSYSGVPADDNFVWLRVHSVFPSEFVGYAFDCTTETSLYCSDGFVVGNCRCSFIPANVGERDR